MLNQILWFMILYLILGVVFAVYYVTKYKKFYKILPEKRKIINFYVIILLWVWLAIYEFTKDWLNDILND